MLPGMGGGVDATGPHPGQRFQFILLDIRDELPGRVADLYSIKDDLQFAQSCGALYYRRNYADTPPPDDQVNTILSRALWSAALTAYRRAFTTGRSFNPGESRFNLGAMRESLLSAEQQQAHDGFWEVSNQHIAHRSSDRDRVLFLACLNPPPFPRGIDGVAPILAHQSGPPRAELESFIDICKILIAYAEQEINTFLDAHIEELKKRDLDQLYEQAGAQAQAQAKLLEQLRSQTE